MYPKFILCLSSSLKPAFEFRYLLNFSAYSATQVYIVPVSCTQFGETG